MSGQTGEPPSASSTPDVEEGSPTVRDIEVSPDKIVAVADVIEEQARALQRKLAEHLMALRIASPADDIVSTHAVDGWNAVISSGENSYEGRVEAYVHGLRDLADQLRAAGRKYLESDEDKAAAFQDRPGGN